MPANEEIQHLLATLLTESDDPAQMGLVDRASQMGFNLRYVSPQVDSAKFEMLRHLIGASDHNPWTANKSILMRQVPGTSTIIHDVSSPLAKSATKTDALLKSIFSNDPKARASLMMKVAEPSGSLMKKILALLSGGGLSRILKVIR